MRWVSFFAAAVAMALAFWRCEAGADEPWDGAPLAASPAALLRAATATPAPENADLERLLEDARYEFDAQGRKCFTVWRVYRCLTEDGVKSGAWSEGEWSPYCEEKPTIRARVITPDGAVHTLDPKTIAEVPVEMPADDVLTDRRGLRAPLPAVKVGAVVEEEIVVRQVRPLFNQGTTLEHALMNLEPTRKLRVTIEAPAGLPLRYEVRASDAKPARSEQNGRVRLVFEVRPPAKPVWPEPYLPPEMPAWPSVAFSTGKSWADVAAGYAALVEPQLDVEAVKPLVRETLGAETDRRKVAAKLLAKLRETVRYVAVEFGQAALVPAKPQETLSRRYGDCKDQSALLAVMLRAAGQPAQVALVDAGQGTELVPGLPGMGRFNHALVYVPGDPPLWIDPAASDVPFGELPAHDQGRWALVAAPGTKELVRTPRGDYRQNATTETFEYFLSEGGLGRVCETVTTTGSHAQAQRAWFGALGREKMAQSWKEQGQRSYGSQSLSRFEYTPPTDISGPFEVRAEFTGAHIGDGTEDEVVLQLAPRLLFDHLPWLFTFSGKNRGKEAEAAGPDPSPAKPGAGAAEKPGSPSAKSADDALAWKGRKSPLFLRGPHIRQLRYRIVPPPGFRVREVPKDEVKRFGPAAISCQFAIKEGGTVEASFGLDTGPGAFTAAEVNALRQGILDLSGGDVSNWCLPIAFVHSAMKLLAEGRLKESAAELQQWLQKEPGQPEHHRRFSELLLSAGLGEAARQEARRAVELAPKSALAHLALASALTHDLLGRPFRPGIDWSGAAESYRKALELDPTDWGIRARYAQLLERGPDGSHYGPESRLEEALDQYRQARKQRGQAENPEDVDTWFALLLLRTGKLAEAEKAADGGTASSRIPAVLLAVITAARGPEQALQKSRQLGLGADERGDALLTAASYLDWARLYPQAKALYEAGAEGSKTPNRFRGTIKALERFRRFEDCRFAQDDPRWPVQQLCIAVLFGGKQKEQARSLFVKRSTDAQRAAALRWVYGHCRRWLKADTGNLRPPQSTADVVSLWKIAADGDKKTGHRVRVSGLLVEPFTCYVAFEDGTYRLLACSRSPALLGEAALERLATGDTAGAKRWLDWAWEEEQPGFAWFNPFADSAFAAGCCWGERRRTVPLDV
jgi:transglutaminase-like putative cysteine protease/tetratricopeptide (TPR) repeat protein